MQENRFNKIVTEIEGEFMKKRSLYIDVVKSIAIILMVYGHCIQYFHLKTYDFWNDIFYKYIYSFHMPLFALISGYVLNFYIYKYNLKDFICNKFVRIGIPAYIWGGTFDSTSEPIVLLAKSDFRNGILL